LSVTCSSIAGPSATEDSGWKDLPQRPVKVGSHAGFKQGDAKTKGHHFPLPEAAESTGFILKHTVAGPQPPAAPSGQKAAEFYTPKEDLAGLRSDTPIDKALPNVLLLGDSISIGYTRQVREGLKGKANVIRPNANCGDTRNGLAQLEAWLGDGKWQVIHFNWGLHDLCYRNPELKTPGKRDKIKGALSVSLPEYEKNLEALVVRLKRTGAKLIFANTTLVPEGEEGRFVGDELKYNAAAERVMNRHGVLVNDLHSASRALPPSMFAGPGNVHFSAAGSAQLAAQVVSKVEAALAPVPPPAAAQPKSVLFIGDAAGAQYAERLRDLLKPRIELHFLSAPRGGKAQRDAFLGELAALVARHDLVLYAGGLEAARVSLETGKPELGAPQFRQFLEELRKTHGRGKKSGGKTKWIWATAVPVPEGHTTLSSPQNEACNRVLTDLAYNRHAILLDLHEYVRIRREDMQRPGDFLLSEPGVTLIASVVANKIEEVMLEGSVPGLPNVLVLGDSIVGQYSTFLRGSLLHKANVRTGGTAFDQRPAWPEIVRQQVTEAERELGRPFDLIQFNWGLHALKWAKGGDYSMELKAGYERCVPADRYGAELEKLVAELAKTGRRLVFATTTPANNGSQPDDALTYNSIALEVMRRHHIPVNDLGAFVVAGKLPMQGCHYPRESAEQLGKQVAGQILRILSEPAR
jgi:hypothetical protein